MPQQAPQYQKGVWPPNVYEIPIIQVEDGWRFNLGERGGLRRRLHAGIIVPPKQMLSPRPGAQHRGVAAGRSFVLIARNDPLFLPVLERVPFFVPWDKTPRFYRVGMQGVGETALEQTISADAYMGERLLIVGAAQTLAEVDFSQFPD